MYIIKWEMEKISHNEFVLNKKNISYMDRNTMTDYNENKVIK